MLRWMAGSCALLAMLLIGSQSMADSFQHDFELCVGEFALCAASTCTPDGKTIVVNGPNDTKVAFPEAQCTCPIFTGAAIADLNGGTMTGSCLPPSSNEVWSLYSPEGQIPQAMNDWKKGPKNAAALPYVCPPGNGDQFANCFGFPCVRAGRVKATELATCDCALGESLEGTPVSADTAFYTEAGQCQDSICSQHPAAVPFGFAQIQSGQCLERP